MMKRFVAFGIGLVFCFALCISLAGCGDSDNPYGNLNLDDYIKVGQYKGLSTDPVKVQVTDEDVQAKIDEALSAAAEQQELGKDEAIKEGDTANIDYSGKLNGKEFEGGTAQGTDLEIGSGTFIKGFESGLVGKHAGEKVSLDLTFPKDYQSKELAGKDVVFDVTINSVKRTKTPKYTEDFVKKNTDSKSKKEYEKSLRKEIKKEKEESAVQQQKQTLWSQVLEQTKMLKYPEEQLEAYQANFDAQVDKMAEQYGQDRSQIIAQYFGASDEKEFKKMIKESAQTLIKQEMAIESISDAEKLKYSEKEKEAKAKEISDQGYDEDSIKEYTGRTMDEYIHINLLYEKVQDFILDNAKVTKK